MVCQHLLMYRSRSFVSILIDRKKRKPPFHRPALGYIRYLSIPMRRRTSVLIFCHKTEEQYVRAGDADEKLLYGLFYFVFQLPDTPKDEQSGDCQRWDVVDEVEQYEVYCKQADEYGQRAGHAE